MTKKILDKSKGRTEILGDGKSYTFAAPSLRILGDLEHEIFAMGGLGKLSSGMSITLINLALYVRLRPNHPDITMEKVGDLFDTQELIALAGEIAQEMEGLAVAMAPESKEG